MIFFRYRLQFDRESKAEIEARKKAAQEPLEYVTEVCWVLIFILSHKIFIIKALIRKIC